MSNSDEHNYHGRALRNMAEAPDKNRGCCTKHPVVCCCFLVVALVVAAITGALLGAFVAAIQAKVDEAIGEVSESAVVLLCAVVWLHLLIPQAPPSCMTRVESQDNSIYGRNYTGKGGCMLLVVHIKLKNLMSAEEAQRFPCVPSICVILPHLVRVARQTGEWVYCHESVPEI